MQMDRLLAPTRPYNGVVRPGDGKVPDNIAFILCTGSRDETLGNPMCSRICCMYSVKHNQLIMGALPLADVTVYYMDIRTPSKGYNEFYEQAKGMGANFVKGRVASITEKENGNLVLKYEDVETGTLTEMEHDMVVLAVGARPNDEAARLFADGELSLDEFGWVGEAGRRRQSRSHQHPRRVRGRAPRRGSRTSPTASCTRAERPLRRLRTSKARSARRRAPRQARSRR